MKTKSRTMNIGLCALALGAAMSAHGGAPVITDTALVPRFTIQSDLGVTNQIQYSADLSQTNWVVLTNLLVTQSPYWFVDVDAPPAPRRFYRVLALGTNSPVPPGMALIPAGSFTMGNCMDSSEGWSEELPLHAVYVSAFCMEKHEVTKSLWDMVYQWAITNGYSFDHAGSGKAANHPVQTIDWYDCVKWCNARSEQEGRTPAYYTSAAQTTVYRSGQTNVETNCVNWSSGYRLPTEAEWEKASRGGLSGHRFPWGDTISESQANYYGNTTNYDLGPDGYNATFAIGGEPYTSPVGYFGANGYGLYDMAGNVLEWCWDWYGEYSSGSQTDPRGPASGSLRVLRGGSWSDGAVNSRAAGRSRDEPTYSYRTFGFRSVLPPGQP
ncbi:MAG: SUMF1/EgtB/PvdO family nonheme iron enzyme [Verrucomicrobiota bacterium]